MWPLGFQFKSENNLNFHNKNWTRTCSGKDFFRKREHLGNATSVSNSNELMDTEDSEGRRLGVNVGVCLSFVKVVGLLAK